MREIWTRLLCGCVLATFFASGIARGATPEEVQKAIQRGKEYLYSKLNEDGNWELSEHPDAPPVKQTGKRPVPKFTPKTPPRPLVPATPYSPHSVTGGQWGGLTSIATYALLTSGEDPKDEKLAKAITFLRDAKIKGTYAIGFRALVWAQMAGTKEAKGLAYRDASVLMGALQATKDEAKGMYGYIADNTNKGYDHSTSQFGVLAMWGCSEAGFETPMTYWSTVDKAWRNHQYPDGGWGYKYTPETPEPRLSMTAAGVASLHITQNYLKRDAGIDPSGNVVDANIERGLTWIANNVGSVGGGGSTYTLYALERIGELSGLKHFGTLNWYKQGTDALLQSQGADGGWNNTVQDTCFAIMFLSRGSRAVGLSKLQYEFEQPGAQPKPGAWNQRPRDIANLTEWISKNSETRLNWQVVNLKAALEDLFDAPLLYLAGSQALEFSDLQVAKLRAYIDAGGILIGHADGGSKAFADSFRKLGQQMYPSYEFRELPQEHLIYTAQQYPRSQWAEPPSVLGLSNGIRELMLLIPTADPGRYWQTKTIKDKEPLYQLMSNILQYATERTKLTSKIQQRYITRSQSAFPQHVVKVARLRYPGNWNPEPGGWRRLALQMYNEDAIEVKLEAVDLGEGKLAGGKFSVAHLTGTGSYKFTPKHLEDLQGFLGAGGILIIDAAGGDPQFASSIENDLLTGIPLEPIQANDPLLSEKAKDLLQQQQQQQGQPIIDPLLADTLKSTPTAPGQTAAPAGPKLLPLNVQYRAFAKGKRAKADELRLKGLRIDNHWAVVYATEDLSTGLNGQTMDGVLGYSPETATQIVRRIIVNGAKKLNPGEDQ